MAGYMDFVRRVADVALKDAHRRGMTIIESSDSASPSLRQNRKRSASTMIAGTARYVGLSSYAAGFAKGAQDAGKAGIMRNDAVLQKTWTFPVSVNDLVSPVDFACPNLEILEG
jgi:hypothetical protein